MKLLWLTKIYSNEINAHDTKIVSTYKLGIFSSATTCPLRLRGLPPGLWLKCNRLLKLGRPVGAVMLSRWEWWWDERWFWGARGALNIIYTNYPDHGHHGRLPLSRKNGSGRAGNRTRDLMVSIQELWPPSHEASNKLGIWHSRSAWR